MSHGVFADAHRIICLVLEEDEAGSTELQCSGQAVSLNSVWVADGASLRFNDRMMLQSNLHHLIAIAAGGAAGAACRHLTNIACLRLLGSDFAYGTLAVNVVGCFLLGLLVPLGTAELPRWPAVTHSAMTVGFLGALTTFSTFGLETARFIENDQLLLSLLNIAGNTILGMAAVYSGLQLGRLWAN